MAITSVENVFDIIRIDKTLDTSSNVINPMTKFFYPDGGKPHNFLTFGIHENGLAAKNIPCVLNGNSSYPLDIKAGKVRQVYPQEIRPSTSLKSDQLRDLIQLKQSAIQEEVEIRRNQIFNTVRLSVEAEISSVFANSGTLTYPIANGTEIETGGETIAFGSFLTYAHGTSTNYNAWDNSSATVEDLIGICDDAQNANYTDAMAVYKGSAWVLCSDDMFALVRGIIGSYDAEDLFQYGVETTRTDLWRTITLDRYTFVNFEHPNIYTYGADGTQTAVDPIRDQDVFLVPKSIPKDLLFFRNNSIEDGFGARPIYFSKYMTKDPESVKIIGTSRPLPYIYSGAIIEIDAYETGE